MPTFDSETAAALHRELHSHLPSDPALRVRTLESLAVERGLVAPETLDAWIEAYSEHIGPKRGADVVARAWTDPGFRERLLADAAAAIRDFGFEGSATGHLKAVENTDDRHNLIVCTLCSCYPFSILGMSPAWYKSAEYRARAVREPRRVLAEFGVTLPERRRRPGLGQHRRAALPRRPAAARRHRRLGRGASRRHRHPQRDDRHRARPEAGAGLMDGIHDLGGMQGFGPVPVKAGDAPFRDLADWEKRMWALARSGVAAGITIDWFRHGLERMVPADYLRFGYFNKWCANYLMLLLDNGTITMADVERGHVEDPDPPAEARTLGDTLGITRAAAISFATEPAADPAFAVGQAVRTQRRVASDHTRLPRYARDAPGRVIAHHGAHLLPDEGVKGNHVGDHLYTVAFTATELWGPDADPRDSVTLDLWERYLVPA